MRWPAVVLFFCPILFGGVSVRASDELNAWPFFVEQPITWDGHEEFLKTGLGPFLFSQPVSPDRLNGATRAYGFRPIFFETRDNTNALVDAYFLYPLFSYRRSEVGYRWSVFELINHYSAKDRPDAAPQTGFDLWPFYFSRDTGSSETSYHALFPIFGTVKNRFAQDKFTWVLFPLYGRFEKGGAIETDVPWPFIKILEGGGHHGFEFWPLFGHREKEGDYRDQFYLWPLIYKNESHLSEAHPSVKIGFLPFYAAEHDGESRSETYLWPFFGYSNRIAPYHYHQTNYFWPFWVQGRGDDRYVNRWAPFYTHSDIKGTDKKWVMWPLWRQQTWVDGPLRQTKRQFLYLIYNDVEQRSATNPNLPTAHRTNLWPLVTFWDNGAGRRQVQALSPFEVLFPRNEVMRLNYSPIFAVYRYDRQSPGHVRQSLLWNLITYRREPEEREFHFGPLFSTKNGDNGSRYTIGAGLIAFEKSPSSSWQLKFFDFKRRASTPPPSRSPSAP